MISTIFYDSSQNDLSTFLISMANNSLRELRLFKSIVFFKTVEMLYFLILFYRVHVSTTFPVNNLNFLGIFNSCHKSKNTNFDEELILRETSLRNDENYHLLCVQFLNFPPLKFFQNKNQNNQQIHIDNFFGSSFLKNEFKGIISNCSKYAQFRIIDDKTQLIDDKNYEEINVNDLPFEIRNKIQNQNFPIFVYGKQKLLHDLKCAPQSNIIDFRFVAYLMIFMYIIVVYLSNRKQPNKFYELLKEDPTKNSEHPGIITGEIKRKGLACYWNGKIFKEIIKGLNMAIHLTVTTIDQKILDKITFDNMLSHDTYFSEDNKEIEVKIPIPVANETVNIEIQPDATTFSNDYDPMMICFYYLYIQTTFHILMESISYENSSHFIKYVIQTFGIDSVFFYLCKEKENKLLFHEEPNTSNDKSFSCPEISKEELAKIDTTPLFEKSNTIIKNGFQYFVSKAEFGSQKFLFVMAIKENSMQLFGVEDYFRRFFSLALAFNYFTTSQNCNEVLCKNYLSMLQSSHAFTVTEYFEDMKEELSTIGGLEEGGEKLLKNILAFDDEQRKRFEMDVQKLKKSGQSFSQQQYKANIRGEIKWFSISGRMSYDNYYNKNVILYLFEDVTHLHKLELQTKETLNDLSLASQLLGLHKFNQKKDGTLQLSNSDLLKELGYPENASRNLLEYVLPNDKHLILNLKESETVTMRFLNKNGETQWWTVICTSDNPGKLKGFSFSVQELTELRSKVKSTRDCFEIGSSTNAFAFWAINLDPQEPPHSVFTTKKYEYLIKNTHPDFHEMLALDKLKAIEAPVTLEVQLRLETMIKYIWFSLTLIPMGGRQLLCFAFNIDERKKTHDLLLQTQRLLELAFTYSDVKMWAFEDRHDTVITSDDDQMIMDWSTLQHNLAPEFHEKVCNAFQRTLEGNDKNLEIEVPFFFDSLHWLLMRGIRIDEHKLVGICIDTTAIKETSQELEKQKAAAEEASMAKSMFLANMSHEIRTPLNGICGLLEILQSSDLTAEQTELTDCIQSSFTELLELLNDTLDLAKLESHKVIPLSVKFDASETIGSLQETIFLRKKKPGFSFRVFSSVKAPIYYKGDPHCFVRIVNNILSNSTKNTEKGNIDIIIKELPEGAGLQVEVSDTGVGISENRLQSIREHFAHGEMMAVYENTCVGVGLSLVTEMIRFMKGSIFVESQLGVGTKFTFTLPFEPIYYPISATNIHKDLVSKLRLMICNMDQLVANMIEEFALFYGFSQIQKLDCFTNSEEKDISSTTQFKQKSFNLKDDFDILFIDHDNCDINYNKVKQNAKIALLMSSEPKDGMIPSNRQNCFEIDVLIKPLKPNVLRDFLIKVSFNKEEPINRQPSNQITISTENINLNQLRILAVDDNSTNQLVLKKMLKKLGCSFEVVSNGKEAVEIVQHEKFDLILMDQFMPILDGPQATQEIRKLGGYLETLPIIAMTASILQEDEEKCKKAGMNAFICKPVTLKNLHKVLCQFCRQDH